NRCFWPPRALVGVLLRTPGAALMPAPPPPFRGRPRPRHPLLGTPRPEHSAASPWQLVGREKSSVRRRLADLQRWSVFFTCFVAVLFSFFSAHDLDCSMNSPSLYNYIHNFTYVFILRLGVNILTFCCRTIKDYEDAAATSEAMCQAGGEMRKF
ncbi:unnamed protein product, partial [Prorocentrum cordatum]